jgi:serine/threonine protein kinase, bacterial
MTTQLLNDRYQIIRKLGSGRFGDTFLAEDTQRASRLCVIKCLHIIQGNLELNQLAQHHFQRRLATVLEELGNGHSQIPHLYDYFYGQVDQQFYLIQEWVDGDTLGTIFQQQGKFSEVEVQRFLVALLPVLDYIHSQGALHQDVQPENIILRRSDQQLVLIDFGLINAWAMNETMAIEKYQVPMVIGTPDYIAIEQLAGKSLCCSDLYGLGLTAIYLLTGKQPHEFAKSPDTNNILWQSDADDVSSEFADILNKAIAFKPIDRYQTAGEFLEYLQGDKLLEPRSYDVGRRITAGVIAPNRDDESVTDHDVDPRQELSLDVVGNHKNTHNRTLLSRLCHRVIALCHSIKYFFSSRQR